MTRDFKVSRVRPFKPLVLKFPIYCRTNNPLSMEASKIGTKRVVNSVRKRGGSAIPLKFKRRAVSAIRDFPPCCGPTSEENRLFEVVRTPEPLFVRGSSSGYEPSIGENRQIVVIRDSEGIDERESIVLTVIR
ncbi:hypothetical protein EPI10_011317 [Gossypium australe]|uniref:Uncharacterized protein n=1 Tax=Gossypium australe TaxID=47621 RepID=A0A5B6W997_9ROSI|nr:hypothetical protein EPI10_011317 [Gossypium australe]